MKEIILVIIIFVIVILVILAVEYLPKIKKGYNFYLGKLKDIILTYKEISEKSVDMIESSEIYKKISNNNKETNGTDFNKLLKNLNQYNELQKKLIDSLIDYYKIVEIYKLKKPTKLGKLILKKDLSRLIKLIYAFKETLNFINVKDAINSLDFLETLNKCIIEVTNKVQSDISIIKN